MAASMRPNLAGSSACAQVRHDRQNLVQVRFDKDDLDAMRESELQSSALFFENYGMSTADSFEEKKAGQYNVDIT
jgi:hypothetical protein